MDLGSGLLIFRQTEICQFIHAPTLQNVLRIEIPVLNPQKMQFVQPEDQVCIDFQDFLLSKWCLRCHASLDMRLERARGGQLQHYARLLRLVNKVIFNFDHEGVVDLAENCTLSSLLVLIFETEGVQLPLRNFHGKGLLVRFLCDAVHFGESTSPQEVVVGVVNVEGLSPCDRF